MDPAPAKALTNFMDDCNNPDMPTNRHCEEGKHMQDMIFDGLQADPSADSCLASPEMQHMQPPAEQPSLPADMNSAMPHWADTMAGPDGTMSVSDCVS
jgi:hypothetical protein